MKSDVELLTICVGHPRLPPDLDTTFTEMLRHLNDLKRASLSPKQRAWVLDWIDRLSKDTGQDLLTKAEKFEEGIVEPTEEEREKLKEWLKSIGPKPLKPPGVRVKS